MPDLIRIGDDVTEAELLECLSRLARAPHSSGRESRIDAVLDEAVARGAWLVFYAHDVADRPTRFGVTPGRLAYAVDGARARGLRIDTVAGLLGRAAHPATEGEPPP